MANDLDPTATPKTISDDAVKGLAEAIEGGSDEGAEETDGAGETPEAAADEPPAAPPAAPPPPGAAVDYRKQYDEYKAGESARSRQAAVEMLQQIAANAPENVKAWILTGKAPDAVPVPGAPAPTPQDLLAKRLEKVETAYQSQQQQQQRDQFYAKVSDALDAYGELFDQEKGGLMAKAGQTMVFQTLQQSGFRADIKATVDAVAKEMRAHEEAAKQKYIGEKKAAAKKVAVGAGSAAGATPAGQAPPKPKWDSRGKGEKTLVHGLADAVRSATQEESA